MNRRTVTACVVATAPVALCALYARQLRPPPEKAESFIRQSYGGDNEWQHGGDPKGRPTPK